MNHSFSFLFFGGGANQITRPFQNNCLIVHINYSALTSWRTNIFENPVYSIMTRTSFASATPSNSPSNYTLEVNKRERVVGGVAKGRERKNERKEWGGGWENGRKEGWESPESIAVFSNKMEM